MEKETNVDHHQLVDSLDSSGSGLLSVDRRRESVGQNNSWDPVLDWQEGNVLEAEEELALSEQGGASTTAASAVVDQSSEGSPHLSIGAAVEKEEEMEVEKETEEKVLQLTPTLAQQLEQVLENRFDRLQSGLESKMTAKLEEFKQEMRDEFKEAIRVAKMDPGKNYPTTVTDGRLMLAITRFSTEFAKGDGEKDRCLGAPAVQIGGFPWRIWAYPDGSGSEKELGFYLYCGGNSKAVPGWSCLASATLRLVSQKESQADKVRKLNRKTFNADGNTWGFDFVVIQEILDPTNGWIDIGDTVTLVADVHVEASSGSAGSGSTG